MVLLVYSVYLFRMLGNLLISSSVSGSSDLGWSVMIILISGVVVLDQIAQLSLERLS
jgi:hypothetical protein